MTSSTACCRPQASGRGPSRWPSAMTACTCAPPTTTTPGTWRPAGTAAWPSASESPEGPRFSGEGLGQHSCGGRLSPVALGGAARLGRPSAWALPGLDPHLGSAEVGPAVGAELQAGGEAPSVLVSPGLNQGRG